MSLEEERVKLSLNWKRKSGFTAKIAMCALLGGAIAWSGIAPHQAEAAATTIPGVAAGAQHSAALLPDGTFWVWGENDENQLGVGAASGPLLAPVKKELSNIASISIGHDHTIVVNNTGNIVGFGSNWSGQLGVSYATAVSIGSPQQVTDLSNVKAVTTGQHHSLALMNNGVVYSWGANEYDTASMYGLRTSTNQHIPMDIYISSKIKAVAAGVYSSFAINEEGQVYAWGLNDKGQLGEGTYTNQPSPVNLAGLNNVKEIATSGNHTLALKEDGTVWAWGNNDHGQLGNGTINVNGIHTPNQVSGLTNIKAIAVGSNHSIALDESGHVYLWGHNEYGQLGDGTIIEHLTPVAIPLVDVISIAAGFDHTLAMTSAGEVWGWGSNSHGQVGVESAAQYLNPVKVFDLPPSAPANLRAKAFTTEAMLGWSANSESDFDYYKVYWRMVGTSTYSEAVVYGTSYTVTNLRPLTYYEIKVTAVDEDAGHESNASVVTVRTSFSVPIRVKQ
jgi:alpha-tubulin suppressor-like RCC1 family protein